jgi:hypothetical protein
MNDNLRTLERSKVMKKPSFSKDPEKFIEKTIIQFAKKSPANRRKVDGGRYWDQPLVGFASGEDPLFKQYKKIIGKYHLTPKQIFELTFGKAQRLKQISVISWVLPASEDIPGNRKEDLSILLWAHAATSASSSASDWPCRRGPEERLQGGSSMNSPCFRRLKSPGWV